MKTSAALLPIGLALLAGCANKHIYEGENFKPKEFYSHVFEAPPPVVLRAARNTALQAHYVVQSEDNEHHAIKVFKSNQIEGEDDRYGGLTVEMNIAYASAASSTVRCVAVERQYEVTKNKETAEMGVGPIITIPLPTGETQTVTEIRRDTVDEADFYEAMYKAIDKELDQAKIELDLEATHLNHK
ncbi:DUF2242 domain-containing protein [Methylomagnum ishizawai]|uniref:DUF2242 domain-containing protein n=1 Tax=Methylomagnum ishizawai TaxID=1760988 RepID=UPI001C33540F|nr:DUF2242 domain-containing protein [Methylomagnum ishizawai]BBL74034.1 hypothetical protein MishRS11D_11320 [Methylomagnum ishizawai]